MAAIEEIGFEFTEAAHAIQRLIVADMDLTKAHLAFSALVALKARSSFRPTALALSIALRAGSVAYLTGSLAALLAALSLFATLELGAHADRCWRTNRDWLRIQAGMTRRQVLELLGDPVLEFERGRSGEPAHDGAKVLSKDPPQGVEWMPPGFSTSFRYNLNLDALAISGCGLAVLALASWIPFGVRAGWNSWALYIPVAALVLGAIYESTVTGGWRFDWFFLAPAYLMILGTWRARLWAAVKS